MPSRAVKLTPLSSGEHARQIEQARAVEVAAVVAELVDDVDANIMLEWMWHHAQGLPNPWAICPLASSL
jgi:hypothetical protein